MKPKKVILLAVLLAVAGCVAVLVLPGNYYVRRALVHTYPKIDQYPIFENRVVRAGNPVPLEFASGVSGCRIDSAFEADFARYGTVAFLVMRNGRVELEQYWEDYGEKSHSNSFSMAKSIVSLLIGCAIADGCIESVDQPVSDFLPEWGSFNGRPLLIRDLLTMSAGVKWDESSTSLFSTTTEAYYGKDLWGLARREVLVATPGEYFNYQSGVTQILAFLLKKATGRNIADYASEKIWTPIEAEEDALWSLDRKDGMEKAYCCFNSNARDFARLGQLVLQNGYWYSKNGRVSVVDSAYVAQATSPATYLKAVLPNGTEAPCTMYGYQFWLMNYKGHEVKYFRGILGQYIMVIPDLDMVVVRLGHKRASEYNAEWDYPVDMDVWLKAALHLIP
ncbi:MAG: beta-lactamase family protein [Bacteroides sp.]|nr:beta-lactamase family protein [Ruminococcus flavefaciens]MCM1554266.1 beta-lactamase family protein [Bacteroides sp.]